MILRHGIKGIGTLVNHNKSVMIKAKEISIFNAINYLIKSLIAKLLRSTSNNITKCNAKLLRRRNKNKTECNINYLMLCYTYCTLVYI
jgi:hypothetical protein